MIKWSAPARRARAGSWPAHSCCPQDVHLANPYPRCNEPLSEQPHTIRLFCRRYGSERRATYTGLYPSLVLGVFVWLTQVPCMFEPAERSYIEMARVGRLATADTEGRPHVVPVCFALVDDQIVTAIDEKPQNVSPDALQRSRNIRENPRATLVVDHYTEEWSRLGWVQIRGTATHLQPDDSLHADAVTALQQKYYQYETHALNDRPIICVSPGSVRSWGHLQQPTDSSP